MGNRMRVKVEVVVTATVIAREKMLAMVTTMSRFGLDGGDEQAMAR